MIYPLNRNDTLLKARLKYLAGEWETSQAEVLAYGIELLFDLHKEKIIFHEKEGKYILTRKPSRAEIIRQLLEREKEDKRMTKLKLGVKKKAEVDEEEAAILAEAASLEVDTDLEDPGDTPLDLAALMAQLDTIEEVPLGEGPKETVKVSKEKEVTPVPSSSSLSTEALELLIAPLQSQMQGMHNALQTLLKEVEDVKSRLDSHGDNLHNRILDLAKQVTDIGATQVREVSVPVKETKEQATATKTVVGKPKDEPKEEAKEQSPEDKKKEAAIIAYLGTLKVKKQLGPFASSIAEKLKMTKEEVEEIICANATITGSRAKWVSPKE